ncbi:hypothetical protein OHR68_29460 [Spirillospora sp. NBC_00431]
MLVDKVNGDDRLRQIPLDAAMPTSLAPASAPTLSAAYLTGTAAVCPHVSTYVTFIPGAAGGVARSPSRR